MAGAIGTAVVDFGSWPGSTETSVSVTGQASIATSSACEAWIRPQTATADHSVDEHLIENIRIVAGNISGGVGFTIYAYSTDNLRLYGQYNVNWVWA